MKIHTIIIVLISIVINIFVILPLYADELYYPIKTNPISTMPPFAGETFYPTGDPVTQRYGIDFWLYNDGSGLLDLNLRLVPKEKLYTSPPVVSPDFDHMIYTQVYYFGDANEVVSKCFYNPVVLPASSANGPQITIKDYFDSYNVRYDQQNRYEILSVTSKIFRRNVFKTLTVVDWAYDSDRVLIKEHVGQMDKGIAGTVVWVYEARDDKLYRVDTIRKAIINYWKTKKNLDLTKHIWDIDVLGWEENSNTRFVVNAYIYPKKHDKQFLGCWSVDINGNMTELMSLDNQAWPVGRYGLMPDPFLD